MVYGLFYFAVNFVLILVLMILNYHFFKKRRNSNGKEKIDRTYEWYVLSIAAYLMADASWGIIVITRNGNLLNIDSSIHNVLMALTIFTYCKYISAYFDWNDIRGKLLSIFGIGYFVLDILCLIANFFNHCIFWYDSQCHYHTGIMREVGMYAVAALFVAIAFITLEKMLKSRGQRGRRMRVIFLFSSFMTFAMIFQGMFPMFPCYSVGLTISILIVFVLIDIEEQRRQLNEIANLNGRLNENNDELQALNDNLVSQLNIIGSLSRSYIGIYYIVLKDYHFLKVSDAMYSYIDEAIGESGDARETFKEMSKSLVSEDYVKDTIEFTNLDTLVDRLKDTNTISYNFCGKHLKWCRGSFKAVSRDESGRCTEALFTIRSIDDIIEEQKKHHLELTRLKNMLESNNIGTWILTETEGSMPSLTIDNKMKELIGVPKGSNMSDEEINGMLYAGIHPDDLEKFMKYHDTMMIEGKRSECDYRWNHPTDGEIYVRCGGAVIAKEDGKIIASGYHYDITNQIKLQQDLEMTIAANNAKTKFLQNMSHEIRTPLNAIYGFAQLLGMPEGTWNEKEREEYNHIIYNSYKMLDMLINDILDSADNEHGNYRMTLAKMNVNNACRNAMSTVEYRCPANVVMRFTTDVDDNHVIKSDERRIQQVLVNFLTNACKFTSKGEIHMHVSTTEKPGMIAFSVTDTGMGVPIEKADEIFGRFVKLNQNIQGSGLGLNICNTIANKLNGEVYLDTSYTGGARFVFAVEDKC